MFDPANSTIMRTCKLYTLGTVFEVQIELQKCPRCPPNRRRYIGPDLRAFGIFNYNNSILATHELLDHYTSCYTSSETPFSSWVTQTARIYDNVGTTFMGQDLFRSVWFSFAFIQNYVGDMVCDDCKSCPDTTIFDGITLAFGKKHLQGTLRPPTLSHPESLQRPSIKYFPAQQLLLDKTLRAQIRSALDGPPIANLLAAARSSISSPPTTPHSQEHSLLERGGADSPLPALPFPFRSPGPSIPTTPKRSATAHQGDASPSTPVFSPSKAILKQVNLVEQHLELLKLASARLRTECPAAAKMFDYYLGPSAYAKRRRCPGLWRSFFKQIAAEESVVQMVNWSAWQDLVWVLENGLAPQHRSRLLSIPVLFKVFDDPSCSKSDLREIMGWIENRTRAVFRGLMVDPRALPAASAVSLTDSNDWRKVSFVYHLVFLVLCNVISDRKLLQSPGTTTSTRVPKNPRRRPKGSSCSERRTEGRGMSKVLRAICPAGTHRWYHGVLVHPQHLLWIPLHTVQRRSGRCLLGTRDSLASSSQARHL